MVGHLPCLSKVPLLTYTQKIAFTNLVLQTWERQGSFSAIRQVFLYKVNFMTCLKEKVNKNKQIHQNHPITRQHTISNKEKMKQNPLKLIKFLVKKLRY